MSANWVGKRKTEDDFKPAVYLLKTQPNNHFGFKNAQFKENLWFFPYVCRVFDPFH
ncbi:hypothetical protein CLV31_109130 [Algoriphagus aquaeductus]|jgi:hypothetical protein|uniref:Uncharacterized protein n=1 Tax=Algoriphagus aquaeductus TaxID=475299 RepID=A0A326RZI6_9BACT|nr:hypothetical protein CLV31_109130 [Algoriphagus aquaeductus]